MAYFKNKKSNRKNLLLIFLLLVLIIGAASYVIFGKSQNKPLSYSDKATTSYSPPTEQEKKQSDTIKEGLAKTNTSNPQSTSTTNGKKLVQPTITYAGQYDNSIEVGAYVGTVFEDGGTCILTLTQNNIIKSITVDAVKNVSAMDCPTMEIKRSDLLYPGKWTAVVSYNSATASGLSEPRSFEVR